MNKFKSITYLVLVFIFTFSISNAQEARMMNEKAKERQEKAKEIREIRQIKKVDENYDKSSKPQKMELKKAQNCEAVVTKIQNRKTQIQSLSNNYSKTLSRIEELISKRIQNLKSQGKDTAEVEANFVKYKSDSQNLLAKYKEILTSLNSIDTSACQTNKNAFSTNVKNFNSNLRVQMQAQNALKKFVRDSIVAKIKVLEGKSNE